MKLKDIPLPQTKSILGTTYKVKRPHRVIVRGEEVHGSCCSTTKTIEIEASMTGELMWAFFDHECLHAQLDESSISEGWTEEQDRLAHQIVEACAKYTNQERKKIIKLFNALEK